MAFELVLMIAASVLILIDITLPLTSSTLFKLLSKYTVVLSLLAFILIIGSYIQLLYAFINNDFSFLSVYSFSSSGLPVLSKVYASWAGAGGSMFLLSIILSLFYLGLRLSACNKPEKFKTVSSQILGFVVLIFIFVTLLRNPFERLAVVAVEGLGLNPQLQSFWMAVHPPIVFSAYAFVVLAFALTLASLRTNEELENNSFFKITTYVAWILLTIGIALGGVWAYAVLGWGGYWAWDPVETASLLPWLILTAYFISKTISRSKTSLTQQSLIMLTFASLVFLSALTRGGFTQSVHSYAVSAIGPVMLSFAVAMMGLFIYFAKGKNKPFFRLEVERFSLTSRSSFLSFWALILISIVCLIGLAFSGFAYSYFTYPFVLLFVISLVGLSLDDKTHYARQFLIVIGALIVGVALSAIGLQSVNLLVTLTAPMLTVTFAALIYRIAKTARGKSSLWQCLFGLAVVVMLLGVFFSSGAKTSNTLTDVETNTLLETLNLTVVVTHVEINNSTSEVFNAKVDAVIPEYSTVTADLAIQDSGTLYSGSVSASFYPNYGLIIEPLIVSTPTGDVYVHLEYTDSLYNALTQQLTGNSTTPNNITLTVQKNPLIYFVWTGIILMVVFRCAELAVDLYQSNIKKKLSTKADVKQIIQSPKPQRR